MNKQLESGVQYDARHAAAYERKIRQLIPGYDTLHALSASLLQQQLGKDARLLVAGSGSGEELARLAALAPGWRFTAVDPAPAMNALAGTRLADVGAAARVEFRSGKLGEVPLATDHAAATALLVLHFLPDDGSKLAFLRAVADALQPDGLLLLADLGGERGEAQFDMLFAAWRHQQDASRDRPEQVALDFAHLQHNVYPVSAKRRDALLAEAGFAVQGEYWRSFGLAAICCRKVGG
ncbi:class I SAM-dependent methyltransferase [Chitinimonas sp.]|uniref:class I SAM-dependent methyltransferase n=1 Tax=Chitinimonas sp. TaxID=1934313 RepID=UPI0035B4D69D